jgi:prevent-host-death family protein
MTKSVGVHEAKTHLSRLLDEVAAGEDVVITRRGKQVARIVPASDAPLRNFGVDRGVFTVPANFDAPLDEATLDAFER